MTAQSVPAPERPGGAENITFHAIGRVENAFDEMVAPDRIRAAPSRIVLNSQLEAGLLGVEPGQQLMVIFYFHRSRGYDLRQHPRGDLSRPRRGVFALRSPRRPNPIGVTVVDVVGVTGNVLDVVGLDAINRTPVLDLKPA
jgi:tRNA-Thr(GGU) m(6)t(6)A37 methyltransferase TsaA